MRRLAFLGQDSSVSFYLESAMMITDATLSKSCKSSDLILLPDLYGKCNNWNSNKFNCFKTECSIKENRKHNRTTL